MRRARTSRSLAVAAAILVAVAALHAAGILAPVTDPVVRAVLRMAGPAHRAGTETREAIEDRFGDRDARIEELASEIDDLRLENAKLRNALEEHEQLAAALDYREREEDRTVLAHVVAESGDAVFHGVVIDRGTDDGVAEGQPVLTADGVIIGKVSSVRRQAASVRLLTDSGSRLAVTIRNGSDTLGSLEGERGLGVRISLIPQSVNLTPGDVVVTSGAEPGIRRGYPVGIIEKVQRSTQDPFQTADVAPFDSALRPVLVQVVVTEDAL